MVIAILVPLILTVAFVSTISVRMTYAQNSTSAFGEITSVFVNGKNYPLKYSITTGKLLGVVEDKDKTTIIAVISALSDKGTLNIEIPRNILDAKGQSNADAKFVVHVDGKDATFRETSNNPAARTLSIDFNKDARLIEIIGTQATQSQ
jgi:membrane-anchored protein YejM (alkaline phosphatase superfamily)